MPGRPRLRRPTLGPRPRSGLFLLTLLGACHSGGPREARWTFTSFRRGFFHGFCSTTLPVLDRGTLYVGTGYFWNDDARVYGLDAATGRVLWRTEGGRSFGGRNIHLWNGTLAFARQDSVYGISSRDGTVRWSYAHSLGYARTGHRGLLLGSRGHRLVALDMNDGRVVWDVPIGFRARLIEVLGEKVYATPDSMHTLAEVTLDGTGVRVRREQGLSPQIAVAGGRLVLKIRNRSGNFGTQLYDPRIEWRHSIDRTLRAVVGDTLVLDEPDGGYTLVDPRTGSEIGRVPALDAPVEPTWDVIVEGVLLGRIYRGVPKVVYAWDLTTGKRNGRFATGEWVDPPLVGPDLFYLVSEHCTVHALPREVLSH